MAKRRLNTKFIAILTGSVIGVAVLSVGGIYIKRRYFREKPDKYIALGKAALESHDYEKARDNLARAVALSPPDPVLDTMFGDALSGLTSKETDYIPGSRGMWEQAIAVDPTYVPALERLVHFWEDDLSLCVKSTDRTAAAEQLAKAAQKLLEVKPDDAVGIRARSQSVIEIMLNGRPTAPSKLNDAESDLLKLAEQTPADASLPYWVARSRLHQAVDAARSDDSNNVDADLHVAETVMTDGLQRQPANASMAFHAGEIFLQMAAIDQGLGKPVSEVKRLIDQANELNTKARAMAQPDDPEYIDINLYDARLILDEPEVVGADPSKRNADFTAAIPHIADSPLAQNADDSAAVHPSTPQRVQTVEQIYRDVLKHRPNDPFTLMALARLLGDVPGRRSEAIELLSKPFVQDHPEPGIKGTLLPVLQSEADTALLTLQLDEIDATRDKTKRDALIARAIPLSEKISGKSPDSPTALGLKGRLALSQNHLVEATQTLRQALSLIDSKNFNLERTRYELTFYLARAYELAQQTGDAEKLALDVVSFAKNFVPARLMLARLYISERNFEQAKVHVDRLAALAVDNPQLAPTVLRMRLQITDPVKDPQAFHALFVQLPESTREELATKAQIAHVAGLDDDALRVLKIMVAQSPGDSPAVQMLAGIEVSRNQTDQARQVVNAAVAANPSDLTLVATKMRLDGKSQDEIDAEMEKRGAASPDRKAAFNQEMAEASRARQQGDLASVDRHLAIAQKLKPDDPHIWDALFLRAIETANWDKAEGYVEQLSTNNVDLAGGVLYRIRLATAQNDLNKALDLALKLTRDKPEFSQSWCALGDVQRSLGKYDEASHSYEAARDRQVQNLDALRGLVQCAYALDKIDAAKSYIDEGQKIDPKNAEFHELALNHELTYGDPQKVIQPRLDAIKESPNDSRTYLNLASTYVAAAQARTIAKDPAGAQDFYVHAEQTLRDAMNHFPNDQRFPLTFSRIALAANDFAAADQVMQTYASRPGIAGLPTTTILLSDFYDRAGKTDLAVKVLQDYLANPSSKSADTDANVNVELRLSALLAKAGRTDDALAALTTNSDQSAIARQKIALLINAKRLNDADKALAVETIRGPLPPELQNLQGMLQLAKNQPAAARQTFDRLLAQHPDDVDGLVERAKLSLSSAMPNIQAAQNDLTHARDVAPRNVEVRLMLAQIDRDKPDPVAASKELEAGLRAVPNDKKLRLTLVDLYARQQQWDDALRVMHEAALIPELADDPDFTHASAVIAMGRGEYPRAETLITQAMSKAPNNMAMLYTYYEILVHEKASTQLISHSDALLAASNNNPQLWKVYPYRARARLIDSSDKAAAADELQHGLDAAAKLHDDAAITSLMKDYRTLIGPDAAMKLASANAEHSGHWALIAGNLCREQDDADGAVRWYEAALKNFDTLSASDQTTVLAAAAAEYQKVSPPDLVKSADLYRRLIQLNPGDVLSLNNLACLLADPGSPASRPQEALDYGERAYDAMTQSGSDEPQIKDTYGWTLIANGQYDKGSSLVQDALSKMDFPEAHYHLAEAMLHRSPSDPEDAASELNKAIKMLDRDAQDGKTIDLTFRMRIQQELKKAREG